MDNKSQVNEPEVKPDGEEKKTLGQKIMGAIKGTKETHEEPTAEDKKDDPAEADVPSQEELIAAAKQQAIDEYIKAQEEKARKEGLTPEELKAEEDQQKDAKLAKLEHDLLVRDCKDAAIKTLDAARLPVALADVLDYTTEETAKTSLAVIQKVFAECLEQGIKDRLKGKTPEGLNSTVPINDYADMTARARKAAGLPEKKKEK